MPSEISFSDGIVLFPEFKVKQRSRRRSDSRIRRLFAEQVFRSWENVGYEYPTYNAETFLQTALFCFPNPKRNNAIGVGRILESDACSQNKFSGAGKMSDTSIRPTTLLAVWTKNVDPIGFVKINRNRMHGTQMPSEISFSDGIVLFPKFKAKQRNKLISD